MRKIAIILLFSGIVTIAPAQIYTSKLTTLSFFSETPAENIVADNSLATVILNTSNNEIAIRVPVKSFIFPRALMQEHFNENYLESSKFPLTTFKGVIIEKIDFKKDGVYKVTTKGTMEMHGVKHEENIAGTLTVKGQEVVLQSEFNLKPADYNIEIPKVVFEKIAENILVKLNSSLMPYVKK